MENSFALSQTAAQTTALVARLEKCNELSQRYGLSLTGEEMCSLARSRVVALRETGRVEFGEGALPALIYAFCDSPYLLREEYAATLATLQDLFYAFKNEFGDTFSDDELIEALQKLYNGRAQGSLEVLENATEGELYRALTGVPEKGDDDA